MLKKTKREETIVFLCDIFIIGSISIAGGRAPPATPMSVVEMLKKLKKIKIKNKENNIHYY